jgi:5,10-methylenetetrahydromethanopterin reductase
VALAGRWSVMQSRTPIAGLDEQTRAQFDTARTTYDMTRHGETHSSHAASMNDDLVDRFAIAGPPDHCIERLRELMSLGLHRIVFNTRIRGATEKEQADVTHLMLNEVLPNVSGRDRDGQPG